MPAPAAPSPQVCQLCALDDYLNYEVEGPGLWRFTCANPAHPEPHSWPTTGRDPLKTGAHAGLANELGIYDDLLALFDPDRPWLEYGVIEYRYGKASPQQYKRAIDTYGHTAIEPQQNSASAFIAGCLGHLRDEGLLASRIVKATGYWHYNGTITAWTRPPVPDDRPLVTWADYASSVGVEPTAWPLEPSGILR